MRRIIGILLLASVAVLVYITLSDPNRKAKVLSVLENSTGLDLKSSSSAVDSLPISDSLKQFGAALNDSQLQNSLKKWGDENLKKLNRVDLKKLQRELKKESEKVNKNFDAVFEKYLKKADN